MDIIDKSGAELRWNPYREKGLIIKNDLVISFLVGSSTIVVNSKVFTGLEFTYSEGQLFLNKESADLLYRLLKIDQEYFEIVKDENLFNIPVIIIDPGHGGRDSGAIGKLENIVVQEKEVVLNISKMVVEKLRNEYSHKKILMTRDEDYFLTLEQRVDLANNIELEAKQAVIYISVHANASLNKNAQGFEVWYLPKGYRRNVLDKNLDDNLKLTTIINALKEDEISLEGQELAGDILDGLNSTIGNMSSNRGLKEEIWFVVRKANMASVLIEVGFVTNELEGSRLAEKEYIKKISDGIFNGIVDFVDRYENGER